MAVVEISLLIRFIIAHVLADFVLQEDSWVKDRFAKRWSSIYLYLHGAIAGVMVYLFSGLWTLLWLPVLVAVVHVVIDGLKAKKEDNVLMFLLDQSGHLVLLLVIWIWITGQNLKEISMVLTDETWIILLAYLIVFWPAGTLIGKATAQWRKDIEKEDNSGLEKAGLWIGRLERFLILTFVLLDQYPALGLLIAAKSIFRFSDIRKIGEYVLIGTLISFVIAIVTGLLALYLIG